jgi:hypothetical protein
VKQYISNASQYPRHLAGHNDTGICWFGAYTQDLKRGSIGGIAIAGVTELPGMPAAALNVPARGLIRRRFLPATARPLDPATIAYRDRPRLLSARTTQPPP